MTAHDFGVILDNRLTLTSIVLGSKAKEYASDADRLHNFKAGAALQGCTPAQALLGYATKHLVGIVDMVKADAGGKPPTEAQIGEKIGDAINYLVLLEAVLREKIGAVPDTQPKGSDAPVQSRPARKPAARS